MLAMSLNLVNKAQSLPFGGLLCGTQISTKVMYVEAHANFQK